MKAIDYTGFKNYKITYYNYHRDPKTGRKIWEGKCECGKEVHVRVSGILKQKSCGCIQKEIVTQYNWQGLGDPLGNGFPRTYWRILEIRAKQKNIPLSITMEEAYELYKKQNGKCALSGLDIPFARARKKGCASLDRIDSDKGYETGNVQWVHKDINLMKMHLPQKRLFELIKLVSQHRNLV